MQQPALGLIGIPLHAALPLLLQGACVWWLRREGCCLLSAAISRTNKENRSLAESCPLVSFHHEKAMAPTESQPSVWCLCPYPTHEVKETTVKHPGAARIDDRHQQASPKVP